MYYSGVSNNANVNGSYSMTVTASPVACLGGLEQENDVNPFKYCVEYYDFLTGDSH